MRNVKDPVCGMMVDPANAIESSHAGHSYHFCSETCRTKFDANPAQYTDSLGASGAERHEPPRTNTHGFVAPMYGSAGSGGLEFEPVPERHDHKDD